MGKTMNAGQICLAPDYILVKDSKEQEVVDELKAALLSTIQILSITLITPALSIRNTTIELMDWLMMQKPKVLM